MDRKITICGIESYDFHTPDDKVIAMNTVHYTFSKKNIEGIACGRFTCSSSLLKRYGVKVGEEYVGVFYTDANKKEKCAALFVEG